MTAIRSSFSMRIETACEALRAGRRLRLSYDGHSRVVEVHTVGSTRDGHAIMRAWQVRGGSAGGERVGWKLMRLDEAASARLTDERSRAPRPDYNPRDPAMLTICCRV